MELDYVIKKRRSTREFSTKSIKKEDVYALLESARLAPSAGNRQPWFFVVVEGEVKDKIANIMYNQVKNVEIELEDCNSATHSYNPTSSVKGSIKLIKEVPIFILVFRKRSEDWKEGDYLSIGCAVEHICLKATDLSLGSIWVRDIVYTRDKIATFLGHEDLELVTGVAIGYTIEYPYERHKKKLEEIIEWK